MGAHKTKRYFPPIPTVDQLGTNNPIINSKTPIKPKNLLPILLKIFGSIQFWESNTLYDKDLYLINASVLTKNINTVIFGPNKSGRIYILILITFVLCNALKIKLTIIYSKGIIVKSLK